MLKPTSNYKMSKTLKTSLALGKFKTLDQRHAWKRACIDAELCSKIVVKSAPRDKNAPRGGGTANYTVTSNSATPTA
jgi:hypothetical protein